MKRFFALLMLTLAIPVILPALAMAAQTDAGQNTAGYQTSAGGGAR